MSARRRAREHVLKALYALELGEQSRDEIAEFLVTPGRDVRMQLIHVDDVPIYVAQSHLPDRAGAQVDRYFNQTISHLPVVGPLITQNTAAERGPRDTVEPQVSAHFICRSLAQEIGSIAERRYLGHKHEIDPLDAAVPVPLYILQLEWHLLPRLVIQGERFPTLLA